MRWSIRNQLLVPLLILLLGVVGISTWTALVSVSRARQQIETQMRRIAATFTEPPFFQINSQVLKMTKGLSGAEFLLVGPGEQRATTLPEEPAALPGREAVHNVPQTLALGPPLQVGDQSYLGSGVRLPEESRAGAILYILYPESLWKDALWTAIYPSLVLGIFGGLAAIVLSVGVAHRLSRRIQALEQRTRVIAAGDFSPLLLPGRDDELRDLGQSVNDMAEKLAQLQEAVQKNERLRLLGQVSGGLAHQLRNSVTGARLAVQLHARDCQGNGDAEALDVALRQLSLVEANLKRFLDLGRTGTTRREPCSLTKLLDETVALLRPQCRHGRIDLRWQPPESLLTVIGDSSQLGHLFLNVLSNAVEAAGPGGWVEVKVREQPSPLNGIVEIVDSGSGPPPEAAARLFEPFVTSKREGVGLGLAVARQVVEAHGGKISWHRQEDATCFRIELPTTTDH